MKPVAFYYRNEYGAFLQVTIAGPDGRIASQVHLPFAGKADALAHARAIGATFVC